MLLPGPEAQQLAIYLGWMLHKVRGGLVAGILFILPGAAVMLALSILYALYHEVPLIEGVFYGIKCAVIAIIAEALLRIGRRALNRPEHWITAAVSFIAIFFCDALFPLIVLFAGVAGAWIGHISPGRFQTAQHRIADANTAAPGAAEGMHESGRPVAALAIGGALWFAPTLVFAAWLGWQSSFIDIGVFFSKLAVVTFGGAYAVLAYVAQQAVELYGWLAPGEMLTGLGLAETTPGPLILVVQFVAFIGAFRNPGPFGPLTAGIIGGLLATWVTFVPCFIWIFLGAPYVERVRHVRALAAALSAITAAVVGVILNLAIWFALHVLFARVNERWFGVLRLHLPDWTTLDPWALAITAVMLIAVLRYHAGIVVILCAAALAGVVLRLLT
jgi:chromate transporter